MNPTDTDVKVIEYIDLIAGQPPGGILPQQSLYADLQMGWMDIEALHDWLEWRFGVEITYDDVAAWQTVEDVIKTVSGKVDEP